MSHNKDHNNTNDNTTTTDHDTNHDDNHDNDNDKDNNNSTSIVCRTIDVENGRVQQLSNRVCSTIVVV